MIRSLLLSSLVSATTLATSTGCTAADLQALDPVAFAKVIAGDATVRKLAGGMKFVEGPAWTDAQGGWLVFSDIPANELKKWTAGNGLTTYRTPSNNANGNLFDAEGRLVSCEHGSRSLTRTDKDGMVDVLVMSYDGKKFNSPNDLAITKAGIIYFTDPSYGIPPGEKKEQGGQYVYRFDPTTKDIKPIITEIDMPNGLVFSPDEKLLYVADSGKTKDIRVYPVKDDGTVGDGKVFCHIDNGAADGIRMDVGGRLWSSAGDGVRVFTADGTLIGTILTPEAAANLCFGGADGKTLFITARTSLYAIDTLTTQAR
jgi:gluconolactonase